VGKRIGSDSKSAKEMEENDENEMLFPPKGIPTIEQGGKRTCGRVDLSLFSCQALGQLSPDLDEQFCLTILKPTWSRG